VSILKKVEYVLSPSHDEPHGNAYGHSISLSVGEDGFRQAASDPGYNNGRGVVYLDAVLREGIKSLAVMQPSEHLDWWCYGEVVKLSSSGDRLMVGYKSTGKMDPCFEVYKGDGIGIRVMPSVHLINATVIAPAVMSDNGNTILSLIRTNDGVPQVRIEVYRYKDGRFLHYQSLPVSDNGLSSNGNAEVLSDVRILTLSGSGKHFYLMRVLNGVQYIDYYRFLVSGYRRHGIKLPYLIDKIYAFHAWGSKLYNAYVVGRGLNRDITVYRCELKENALTISARYPVPMHLQSSYSKGVRVYGGTASELIALLPETGSTNGEDVLVLTRHGFTQLMVSQPNGSVNRQIITIGLSSNTERLAFGTKQTMDGLEKGAIVYKVHI